MNLFYILLPNLTMRLTYTKSLVTAFCAVLLSGILSASAQNAAPTTPAAPGGAPGGAGGGGRRGGGNFDPEAFRKQMADRYKELLKVSDDEWAVIQPLLDKVQAKQMSGRGFGGFGGFGGRGGNGGNGGGTPPATTGGAAPAAGGGQRGGGSPESQALRDAVDNASSTADQIKSSLAALRESRKKTAAELAAAREDLRKVLTLRQEAALVSRGILE